MPKPPSHPRYQAVARSEPYLSSAHRSGGGNNHGGDHGRSGRGSTGRMYHPAGSVSTAGVTSGVPPAQQQSAAPQNFGYGPNTGIGTGSGPGASGMMNPQYGSEFPATTTTSTPRTIPRNFGQQSSPSSSSTYGQSFDSPLQGPNQHNSSPSSAPNFQLTGYQHHQPPLQQPLQHQSLQHHRQHQHQQQQHQSPTIANQNTAHPHPTQFPPQPQSQPQQQHQPPSQSHHHHHHQPSQASPNPPTHNQRPGSPNHNPTTSWTPREDSLLLSSRASHLPWSELQRLHFPGKTANACRKRHERLIEKQQAEEEVDEDRLARIAGEYVRMREELWKGLADRMGMDVKEVEERCLGMGVGRLRVGSRQGGRRRERDGRRHGGGGSYPVVATGTGMGMGMGMGMGVGVGMGGGGILPAQGQHQHGLDGLYGAVADRSRTRTGTSSGNRGPGTRSGAGDARTRTRIEHAATISRTTVDHTSPHIHGDLRPRHDSPAAHATATATNNLSARYAAEPTPTTPSATRSCIRRVSQRTINLDREETDGAIAVAVYVIAIYFRVADDRLEVTVERHVQFRFFSRARASLDAPRYCTPAAHINDHDHNDNWGQVLTGAGRPKDAKMKLIWRTPVPTPPNTTQETLLIDPVSDSAAATLKMATPHKSFARAPAR
ncbi:hypothetical protein B0H65DRAFT_565842 [Neurospora tetraspora]|uniref:Myb-like domain-containing protein n=1 Tax=Neurospora tetraspora TaxID=94610 RepID=A0AAE0J066_9PEZI|nr:hypothetical protein B0H65DRAFT_565842 [Neurospora tetraspora]